MFDDLPLTNQLPNKTYHWNGTDSEELFNKNWKNSKTRAKLINLGYNKTSITYITDSQGFRNSISFNSDLAINEQPIMTLGCSYTFGIGLDEYEVWPAVLARMLKCRLFNAGVSGSSADNAFRVARALIPQQRPRCVFHLVTHNNRREIISEFIEDGEPYGYIAGDLDNKRFDNFTRLTSNAISSELNREKNCLAIAHICHLNNIPYYEITIESAAILCNVNDLARDLDHPGRKSHTLLAKKMYNLCQKQ